MSVFLVIAMLHMSAEEIKETGVDKLSAPQKQALSEWIESNYTKKALPPKPRPVLQENLRNGTLIRLSDNSLWEIDPIDTPITQGWITPVEIKVADSNNASYPYTLTNTLTGSSVKARKSQRK